MQLSLPDEKSMSAKCDTTAPGQEHEHDDDQYLRLMPEVDDMDETEVAEVPESEDEPQTIIMLIRSIYDLPEDDDGEVGDDEEDDS